jgi:hypothetical protein
VRIPVWGWGKLKAEKRYTNELSKILDEFPAGSKGFCENSGLGNGISWKTPGFRRET